jgi:hypothetical protein
VGPSAAPIIEGDCGLLESRSGELKIQLKFCCPWDIHEGLFRKQLGIDLTYERTTVFECGLSLDFLEHDCTSMQQGSRWDLPQLQGRLTLQLSKNQFPVLLKYAKASFERIKQRLCHLWALARVKRVLNHYPLANDLERQFGDVLVDLRKMIHGFALFGGPPRYQEQPLSIGRLLGRFKCYNNY